MPVLDTSVLVAFFNADDPLHERARAHLAGLAGATIPHPVLVELVQVIEHRVRKGLGSRPARKAARDVYRAIEASPALAVEPPRGLARAGSLFLSDERLSLVDAVVIAHALEAGDDIVTYDRKQAGAFQAARG